VNEAQFTVSLRRRDVDTLSKWRYVVTCERCGEDLSDNYTSSPIPSILKINGLTAMARQPAQLRELHRMVRDAWNEAVKNRTPFVMDMNHKVEHPPAAPLLERAIEDHAEKCCK